MHSASTEIGERLEDVSGLGEHGMRSRGPRHVPLESGARTESVVFGSSAPMQRLRELVHQAARVNSKVLLQGETGTGKGLVAREIHRCSRRRCEAFVHVDCAALSPSLIESELFGHEKGSFTGATTARKGRFELAGRGTVFLDEIGDLDKALQSKLLRALEDCTYERVGGTQSLAMTARVIAATSRNLWASVQNGGFREDLFFRLNVMCVSVPSLRERIEDIPALVEVGMRRISGSLEVSTPRVTDAFVALLMDYAWPGNVRELMNLLERILVQRERDVVDAIDLDGMLLPCTPAERSHRALSLDSDDEASLISAALIDTGGVVARAARRLGLPRSSLRYKIRRYRLAHLLPTD